MWFWWYLFFCSLLIPAVMIFFGAYFSKKAPKNINSLFGYRTARSMKNTATWAFAHEYAGKLWLRMGLVLLPLSAAAMLFCCGKSDALISTFNVAVMLAQLPVMASVIFFTERALKRSFDEYGRKKDA
ncbi:MAG: SdpI family protein [Oscillospiraceae bacterium]|nr:SdpI family protein [Oscillospiraceae bacterium]